MTDASQRMKEAMNTAFLHEIKRPSYLDQVTTDGPKSDFGGGVIYRYPEMPPLLEVSGDHYEMGLQYGVLLRPEILAALGSFDRIASWMAAEKGVSVVDLLGLMQALTENLARPLPQRFLDEAHGVAEGSGVPFDTVLSTSLIYDIGQSMGCTGVLMKGADGTIIHGRNNDTSSFGGEELAGMTVVVRHKADGCNAVTHMDYPLWLGVETGYNDQGIAFSEETLPIREPNPDGFSLPYLVRMALEECSTLDALAPLFDRYPTVGAYGCVWSDRKAGRGFVAELTPKGWATIEMKGSLLWNFNHFYDPQLRWQQHPRSRLAGLNRDREAVAALYPQKAAYRVSDAIDFLRLQTGPDGSDYAWCGTRFPVCNWQGSQMIVFDPLGDGFYLGLGPYYAARQNIYHIHNDFSQVPDLYREAIPPGCLVEQVAKIENRLVSRKRKLEALVALAQQFPDDANIHFLVARSSFLASELSLLADHARKAFALGPLVAEYRLYAGLAAYGNKDVCEAIALLEGIGTLEVHPEQELLRLVVLERAWAREDPTRSAQFAAQKQMILDKHDAQSYFDSGVLPLLDALDRDY
jgi:hypothetical protein